MISRRRDHASKTQRETSVILSDNNLNDTSMQLKEVVNNINFPAEQSDPLLLTQNIGSNLDMSYEVIAESLPKINRAETTSP